MRRFVYHNNTDPNPAITDPHTAPEYYNYLRGIWKDNTKMVYGGTAHVSDPKAVGPECDFMFPGDTDPCNWGALEEYLQMMAIIRMENTGLKRRKIINLATAASCNLQGLLLLNPAL